MITEMVDFDDNQFTDDTNVYKYLSLESLIFICTFKCLLFNSIKNWKDFGEGSLYSFLLKSGVYRKTEVGSYLGSSWTLQNCEELDVNRKKMESAKKELEKQGSASMWETYCRNGGVRIKTTIGKILKSINDDKCKYKVFRKKVYYAPDDYYEDEKNIDQIEKLLFRKRYSYSYESEYRFLLLDDTNLKSKAYIPINPMHDLIDSILICPNGKTKEWISQSLYWFISRYDVCENIEVSSLYGPISLT
jgi:hypothetical protein